MIDEIRAEMEAAATAAGDESATSQEVETSSPEETPAPVSVSEPSTTDTTPQPSDTGVAPEAPKAGPIPFDRHQAALANARAKAAEEAEAKYRWLQSHGDQQSVQNKLSILQRAEQDPAGFLRDFAHAAGIDPRTLSGQAAPVDPPPDPDVQLDNGQTTYSHARMQELLAWQQRQTEARFQAELAPIKEERVVQQMRAQASQRAEATLARAKTLPGMDDKDTRVEIASFMKANPNVELYEAWAAVMAPRLQEQVKNAEQAGYSKALSALQTKAGAASPPAPRAGAAPAIDTSNLSIREALEASFRGEL